jgi:hypothetical protein
MNTGETPAVQNLVRLLAALIAAGHPLPESLHKRASPDLHH